MDEQEIPNSSLLARKARRTIIVLSVVFVFFLVYLAFFDTFFDREFVRIHSDLSENEPFSCEDCNLILISLDTLRADRLGAYGYARNTSPAISALADQSLVFRNAFANGYFTLPSHMSIFSGTYPTKHAINYQRYDPIFPSNASLDPQIRTIPEIMKENGYRTVWMGPDADPHLDLKRGFERGFDGFYETLFYTSPSAEILLEDYLKKDLLDKIIRSQEDEKFFWFVHSYVIHAPYIRPEAFQNVFANASYNGNLPDDYMVLSRMRFEATRSLMEKNATLLKQKLSLDDLQLSELNAILLLNDTESLDKFRMSAGRSIFDGVIGYPAKFYYASLGQNPGEMDLRHLSDSYDEGIRFMDHQLGIFFDELKREGIWNKTIIVVTSDHGEELFEHGGFDHQNFYDHTIHIPLIIHVPGMQERIDVEELTQSIDILPTALGILKIKHPESAQGKDMIAVLEGKEIPNEYVFGLSRANRCIRSKEWKYILKTDGKEELFYLVDDPSEQRNLINSEQPAIIEERENLKERLLKWSEGQQV